MFTEEELENQGGENENYIDTIRKLKESTVSKESYNKLKDENKELLDAILEGKEVATEEPQDKRSIEDLRKELFSTENSLSNLEYAEKALELRDRVIEEGGVDPFLPQSKQFAYTEEDARAAQRVAEVMKECVEVADGDSDIFTNELMRRTADTPLKK